MFHHGEGMHRGRTSSAEPGATENAGLPAGRVDCVPATADYEAIGTGQAAADFNAAVGRGWKFNDADMGAYLNALDAEGERLNAMSRHAESLNKIRPPGGEIASQRAFA
jgi:hypothetical protein